ADRRRPLGAVRRGPGAGGGGDRAAADGRGGADRAGDRTVRGGARARAGPAPPAVARRLPHGLDAARGAAPVRPRAGLLGPRRDRRGRGQDPSRRGRHRGAPEDGAVRAAPGAMRARLERRRSAARGRLASTPRRLRMLWIVIAVAGVALTVV